MKKVLAAALLCAVSSFAAWDLFPVKEAGKGEAKLGVQYNINDPLKEFSSLGINLGARYSVIEGLEIAILLNKAPGGFVVMRSVPDAPAITIPTVPGMPAVPAVPTAGSVGKDAKGLNQPIIGLRYWLPMGLGIFADVGLPLGSENLVSKEPDLDLSAGVQYSTKFNEQLSIGSEISFNKTFSDPSTGADLGVAVEVDYSLGGITPWVSVDFAKGIIAGEDIKSPLPGVPDIKQDPAPAGIGLALGVIYDISESLYVDASVWLGVAGDRYDVGAMPITISADVGFNF